MSDEGGAGAGAGAAAAPFEVSWEKLEGLFTQKVLKLLKRKGIVAEHFKDEEDILGLKVGEATYDWWDIATLWNKSKLHDEWGVDRDILKELLENGS